MRCTMILGGLKTRWNQSNKLLAKVLLIADALGKKPMDQDRANLRPPGTTRSTP